MTAGWPPTLDEDASGRAEGEQWRSSFIPDRGDRVYVEAVKVDGCVWIAPIGSDLTDPMVWVRLP